MGLDVVELRSDVGAQFEFPKLKWRCKASSLIAFMLGVFLPKGRARWMAPVKEALNDGT